MSHFVVDSRSLLAVRDRLGALHLQLLGLPALVGGFDGSLGGRGLEEVLDGMGVHWDRRVLELEGEIEQMMQRLLAAATAYERIDGGVARGAAREGRPPQAGSGVTVIGPPPPHHHSPAHRLAALSPAAHRPRKHPRPPGRRHPMSGSGTTVTGGPPSASPGPAGSSSPSPAPPPRPAGSSSGSGVTVID